MVFLGKRNWFPPVHTAEEDGLLAIGGDLRPERLLLAYQSGIFPWFIEKGFVFWFSPPERCVLDPAEVHVSHSMKQLIRRRQWRVTEDTAFEEVIEACAQMHQAQEGATWISPAFIRAFVLLHRQGLAGSVEVWQQEQLVGGLYGVKMGSVFCGESMFSRAANASKLALIHLCRSERYKLVDCQVHNPHLERMGAKNIPRARFMELLEKYAHA